MQYIVVDSSLFINGKVVHEGETVDLPETFAESIMRFLKPLNNQKHQILNSDINTKSVKHKKTKIKD